MSRVGEPWNGRSSSATNRPRAGATRSRIRIYGAEFADPHDVIFRRNALLFKCREDQLGVWIECIDGWITHANRAEVEAKEASLRKAAAQEAETQNRAQHLTELRDKYKDL